jgi:predicted small secreted protein
MPQPVPRLRGTLALAAVLLLGPVLASCANTLEGAEKDVTKIVSAIEPKPAEAEPVARTEAGAPRGTWRNPQ